MKLKFFMPLLSFLVFVLLSCNSDNYNLNENQKLVLAISKASGSNSYLQYGKWMQNADSNIIIIDMYNIPFDSLNIVLNKCDGLLLSGGEDVNPNFYSKNSFLNECGNIDYRRDSLEFILMDYAFKNKMPVLGICRGQQIINVFHGGSLIVDIPKYHPSEIDHGCGKSDSCGHILYILPNTPLASLLTSTEGIKVNSSHHQAIEVPAVNIEPIAYSKDSITEAISWTNPENRSFLLGVQFHPESLEFQHPLSGNIANKFIEEMVKYKKNKNDIVSKNQ